MIEDLGFFGVNLLLIHKFIHINDVLGVIPVRPHWLMNALNFLYILAFMCKYFHRGLQVKTCFEQNFLHWLNTELD